MSLTPAIISRMKDMGIPTHSFIAAANYVRDNVSPRAHNIKSNFDHNIKVLTGVDVETRNLKEAELTFGYLVQESVRTYNNQQFVAVDDCIAQAKKKAAEFLAKNPWLNPAVIAEKQAAAEVVAEANGVTVKKARVSRASGMSKKDRCLALYHKHKAEFGDDKHKMIDLFMKELELSKPGATTYEYNCRKGIWK